MTVRVVNPKDHLLALEILWQRGLVAGDKTGWPSVDKLYTVDPGQLTVLTGWPGSGKSEWLDALLVNLSRQGWKFALYSPENAPAAIHVAKLLEKVSGLPFSHGPNPRIPRTDLPELLDLIGQSFGVIVPGKGAADTLAIDAVLSAAEDYFDTLPADAKLGLVVDPWNELEHSRPSHLSETEYVSATLSRVRGWARARSVHVWIVAHPQKMRREDGSLPVPRPDMISGSQHWWNKADNCITVYRELDKPESQEVRVYVQKVRFKHIGRMGMAELRYDRISGRYHEPPPTLARARIGDER